jgi:hypothetical protein
MTRRTIAPNWNSEPPEKKRFGLASYYLLATALISDSKPHKQNLWLPFEKSIGHHPDFHVADPIGSYYGRCLDIPLNPHRM